MSLTNSPIWFGSGATGGGSFYPVTIDDSLRWPISGCQLQRTVGSPTDAKKHTHAFWVKVNPTGTTQSLNSVYANRSGYYSTSGINHDGRIIFGADYARYYYSTMALRDPSSWVHILQVLDSTEASGSDRLKLYVNGVRQTSFTNFGTPPINWTGSYHATNGFVLRIGRTYTGGGFQSSLLSYTSEYIFVDGQALDPTDFGQFIDGVWVPDTYAGTYGNNGYKLDFSNPANFGEDSSGNSNNFSVTGFSTHDAMPDTPTNNFATWNPLQPKGAGAGVMTLSEGNLKATGGSSIYRQVMGNVSVLNGKWYTETYISDAGYPSWGVGWTYGKRYEAFPSGQVEAHLGYYTGGNVYFSVFGASYANLQVAWSGLWSGARAPTTGDVIGCAADFDNGKFWWSINGEWVNVGAGAGDPSAGTNASQTYTVATYADEFKSPHYVNYNGSAILNVGQDSTFAGATAAGGNADGNGVGDFKYAVPSGFLALANVNLPEPTIVDGSEYFNTLLYTGNGANGRALTGVGFQPDWTWIKSRSVSRDHKITDSVRGVNKELGSQTTAAEVTRTNGLSVFGSDGFTVGSESGYNNSGDTFVAWNWKAGGSAVSNTDGSITSQVSANVGAGFSIVSYVGNSTSGATVGHGLGVQPSMIITKNRDSSTDWWVYHAALGNTKYIVLNSTAASVTSSTAWNNTSPTSTVFTLGGAGNPSNANQDIAYCFADVEGFSKAGSYVGNGSTNGTFVYTGFRPAFVILRRTSSTGGWNIIDKERSPYNPNVLRLEAQGNGSEGTNSAYNLDFTSNGFKLRTTNVEWNQSGGTYIYLAFAENPFKLANAR